MCVPVTRQVLGAECGQLKNVSSIHDFTGRSPYAMVLQRSIAVNLAGKAL